MTEIVKTKVYRNRELLSRDVVIEHNSDDAKTSIRPEFKHIHDKMMRNQVRIDMDVKDINSRVWGRDQLEEELREFISDFCNAKCTGFWRYVHKRYPNELIDSSGGITRDTTAKWTFTLMFENETDLEQFMKDQALMVKLRF